MLTIPSRFATPRRRQKTFGDHHKFLSRVTKTLYYGKYPKTDCTSLPVTELAAELYSRAKYKLSLDYLDVDEAARLSRRASVSPCSLVLALIYLDRLKASNPKYLAQVPSSQLFLISLMVGSKFMQDDGQDDEVNNCEWAVHAGLTIQDINRTEKDFLDAIQWEVFVSEKAFWRRLEAMERVIANRQGCQRGWFSYTDLDLLLNSAQLAALLKTIVNISVIFMASYTASIFAMLGSTVLVTNLTPGLVSLAAKSSPSIPVIPKNDTLAERLDIAVPELDLPQFNVETRCTLNQLVSNHTGKCQMRGDVKWENAWKAVLVDERHSIGFDWSHFIEKHVLRDMIQNSFIPVLF